MTQPQLPLCRDFICEVARDIRKTPSGKQTAPAGTSLKRIYAIVEASPYSDSEYRDAVMKMLEDDSIVLVCRCTIEGSSPRGYHDTILEIETIPDWYDFKSAAFETDYDGLQFDRESHRKGEDGTREHHDQLRHVNYIRYKGITLYIVEDGLPIRAQQALEKSGKTGSAKSRAVAILKRMSES